MPGLQLPFHRPEPACILCRLRSDLGQAPSQQEYGWLAPSILLPEERKWSESLLGPRVYIHFH